MEGWCQNRPRAAVEIYATDTVGQAFVDDTIEDNVARCGHVRPEARPNPAPTLVQKKAAPITPEKKKRWRDYLKKRQQKVS